MSQQRHFDEEQRGYQSPYTPTLEDNVGGSYNRRVEEAQAQKIGSSARGAGASAAQRLGLAIFSLIVLFAGMGFLTSGDTSGLFVIAARVVGLLIVCITVALINYIFNVTNQH